MEAETAKWFVVGVLGCLGIIVLTLLLLTGKLQGLVINIKEGKFGFQLAQSQSIEKRQNNEKDEEEALLRREMRRITAGLEEVLLMILKKSGLCLPAKMSIQSVLRYHLYDAIEENNFKEVLIPGKDQEYLDEIMGRIMKRYVLYRDNDEGCRAAEKIQYPAPEEIDALIRKPLYENWIVPFRKALIKTIRAKIRIYQAYLEIHKENRDVRMQAVNAECIKKNEGYIRNLTGAAEGRAA